MLWFRWRLWVCCFVRVPGSLGGVVRALFALLLWRRGELVVVLCGIVPVLCFYDQYM